MPRDAKDIIGEAALADLLKDYSVTPKPAPPEPKRLVTLEESARRFNYNPHNARYGWRWEDLGRLGLGGHEESCNAADDWLVRTVNRRIIEGLPRYQYGSQHRVIGATYVSDVVLLRTFCGEETP